MSFRFKSENKIENLPPKLKMYFPIFLEKRISELEVLQKSFVNEDLSGFKSFFHRELGIAASYHFYQYEELIEALKVAYLDSDIARLKSLLKEASQHLEMVRKSISKWV